jgi:hypothetical protein
MVLAAAAAHAEERRKHSEPTVVVIWDSAALQAVRDTQLGPPMASIPIRLDSQSSGAHIFVQFRGVQ